MTALHEAARNGDIERLKSLLDNGADVNAKDEKNGAAPLHYAAGHGHARAVKLLLDKGAEVNARDNTGSTPLHWAAAGGEVNPTEIRKKTITQKLSSRLKP